MCCGGKPDKPPKEKPPEKVDDKKPGGSSKEPSTKEKGPSSKEPTKSDTEQGEILIALWNYVPGGKDELQLKKRDQLYLVEHEENNKSWTRVRNANDKREGFVPSEFIASKTENRANEWYYSKEYQKRDIELLLKGKHLGKGSFTVRPRNKEEDEFVLMVRISDDVKPKLKNYRILKTEDGKYKIGENSFDSLKLLIEAHQEKEDHGVILLTNFPARPPPRRKELSKDMEDKFVINREDLKLGDILGKGHYGEVIRGVYQQKGGQPVDVAIKKMKGEGIQAEAFLSEAKIMKSLLHDNLVNLYGVCSEEDPILLVTEFMTLGSLDHYLRKRKEDKNEHTERELGDILEQIARGMSYLGLNNMIHRDLAARNVLVTEEEGRQGIPKAKISDFGLARIMDSGGEAYRAQTVQLALKWMAPEAFAYSVYSPKSDVWSFGVLMFECLTHGKKPYPGKSGKAVQEELATGWRMPQDPEISNNMYNKMLQCWDKDPKMRPTFKELVMFFSDDKTSTRDRETEGSKDKE